MQCGPLEPPCCQHQVIRLLPDTGHLDLGDPCKMLTGPPADSWETFPCLHPELSKRTAGPCHLPAQNLSGTPCCHPGLASESLQGLGLAHGPGLGSATSPASSPKSAGFSAGRLQQPPPGAICGHTASPVASRRPPPTLPAPCPALKTQLPGLAGGGSGLGSGTYRSR